jgi:nucleoside-diphosphate-sugar epimerase
MQTVYVESAGPAVIAADTLTAAEDVTNGGTDDPSALTETSRKDSIPACAVLFHVSAPGTAVGSKPMIVTGACGFIGSHLVDALLAQGHRVIGMDRRHPNQDPVAARNLDTALLSDRFAFIQTDLVKDSIAELIGDADVVFHLAAMPGVRQSWGDAFVDYLDANVAATHRLLTACEQAGIRKLVYASSSSVYGVTDAPSRESDPAMPMSPYGVTKLAGEQLALAFANRPGVRLSVVALRYFTVFGPRQRQEMAMSRMLRAAMAGEVFPLYGDGTQHREFTYVADVVAATIASAFAPIPNEVINVGGGASVRLLDVLAIAQELTGGPVPVEMLPPQDGDVPATRADLTLARRLLGYQPAVSLREGMARHVAWLRSCHSGESVRRSLSHDQHDHPALDPEGSR